VQRLRQRKRRPDKPLALMARDIDIVAKYCTPSPAEREVLQSPAAPIVLMRTTGVKPVAPTVAPQQNALGFMLPYTPLHHLVLKPLNIPIVLTSGNLADEPQCIDNDDARRMLAGIVDYFLFHNRDIVNRVDDSVVRVSGKANLQILRRARGYAPAPVQLPEGFQTAPPILAMGSELKNTFCLLREGQVILSQHLGDLANAAAFAAYHDTLNLYLSLLEHHPTAIATDSHPEYLSTKLGKELAAANALPLHSIQHHHAHIAACLAENGLPLNTPPVLGIALDGLGYGDDGTFWGGEFLFANYREFKRLGTFKPVAMLGGEQAIYQPWRSLYTHLRLAFGDELNLELFNFLQAKPLPLLNQMLEKNINAPLASSCGRLFDAVAAAVGICRESCSYEGQGAIALEALAESYMLNHPEETQGYPFATGILEREGQPPVPYIEPRPMWQALLADLRQNVPQSLMAARFHCGLADAIASMVARIYRSHRAIERVALTGGVFQNQILLQEVRDRLTKMNLQVLTHSQIPPNDGGLSLGQAAIAATRTPSPTP
jgi:hydrogenase maturation protein HypF